MRLDVRITPPRSAGSDRVVVFLHGCPTPPDVLADVARAVARDSTAVQMALPGYGGSAPLPTPWGLNELHHALEEELLGRGLRDVHLVAFSGGSYHAFALAIRGRVSVRGIVALSGVATLSDAERAGFRDFAAAVRQGADLRATAGPRFLSAAYRTRHPEAVAEVERWLDATTASNLAAELEAFASAPDLLPDIARLDIKIVARAGTEDVAVPLAHARAIVEAARHGELQLVEGAGHALTIEDPDGTAAAVVAAVAT